MLFSALGIYNGEKFFPGYTISIDEVKVNGEVRELSGKEEIETAIAELAETLM